MALEIHAPVRADSIIEIKELTPESVSSLVNSLKTFFLEELSQRDGKIKQQEEKLLKQELLIEELKKSLPPSGRILPSNDEPIQGCPH